MENNKVSEKRQKTESPITLWRKLSDKLKNFFLDKFRRHAGKVSSIHYQEAHERYWILWRDIEAELQKNANHTKKFTFKEISLKELQKAESIDTYFANNAKTLSEAISSKENRDEYIDNIINILPYYKIMARNRKRLSTSERDLNTLWQDMNFIRIRLLNEVYQKDANFDLALYLDYCREEAHSLKVQDDPEIKELLHTAALGLVVDKEKSPENVLSIKNEQTVRTISTLLARLKRLRLKCFHEILYRKNAYQGAMIFLLLLAFVLIYGHEIILSSPGAESTAQLKGLSTPFVSISNNYLPDFILVPVLFLLWLIDTLIGQIFVNPLLFIFFSGLVGGFFSAVMKLQDSSNQVQEWAYFKWYVFTKPLVGALGATILFIALKANFIDIKELINNNILELIIQDPIGAHGFTFGFLMGFSERVILPRLKKD